MSDTAKHLEVLLDATTKSSHDFFETMCPMPIKVIGTFKENNQDRITKHFEVVGVIAFSGECVGSASVHLGLNLSKKIAKLMLGLDEITNENDIYDTVGELANIITGGAKTIANSKAGIDFNISCPTIIRGDTFANVTPQSGSVSSLLELTVDGDPLAVMITLLS